MTAGCSQAVKTPLYECGKEGGWTPKPRWTVIRMLCGLCAFFLALRHPYSVTSVRTMADPIESSSLQGLRMVQYWSGLSAPRPNHLLPIPARGGDRAAAEERIRYPRAPTFHHHPNPAQLLQGLFTTLLYTELNVLTILRQPASVPSRQTVIRLWFLLPMHPFSSTVRGQARRWWAWRAWKPTTAHQGLG